MSLDIYFEIDACDCCGREKETIADFNFTYNCSKMWNEAGFDDDLAEGKKAEEIIHMLKTAIGRLVREKEHFDKMNPPNGWGSRKDLVRHFLGPMYAVARRYPKATVKMWR